jgi:hypothetical protein
VSVQPDFRDLLSALNSHGVEFVIVGAFALAHHGRPRATGDLDVWIRPTPENARKLLAALTDFGFASVGLTEKDILSGQVIQLGYPPVRIDLLTVLDGVSKDDIWNGKMTGLFGDIPANYLSRRCLVDNKRATGRPQDLADLESLGE